MAWNAWKDAFLMSDGRVVDHLQQGASHSEGQGYGLVLSVFHGDRQAFDLIRTWTLAHLGNRADGLLNWRKIPTDDAAERMNATDGDIFCAWGLATGADRFDLPEARAQARRIATAVADHCLHKDPRDHHRLIILPAAEGFMRDTKAIMNPSYIMPRALYDLALLIRDPRLAKAASDGIRTLHEIAASGLVPNWVELDAAGIRCSSEHPMHFGYDALRVALYLIWSGQTDHPAVHRVRDLYAKSLTSSTPVVVDVPGAIALESSTYSGFAALRGLVSGNGMTMTDLDVEQGFYPATLDMLCRLAAGEILSARVSR
ncbi:MAG: glycosyl hydrolase family 8 [Paracoccaceae bacterium]